MQRGKDGSFFMDRHAKLPLKVASLALLVSAVSLALRLLTV